jgi:M6 family metalloprotease-like protein
MARNYSKFVLAAMVAALMLFMTVSAFAVPANPRPRIFRQPDGSVFQGRFIGDEHYSFAITSEGFTAVKDPETDYWCYAFKRDGLLIPSTYIVGRNICPYPKNIRPDEAAIAAMPENKFKMINVPSEVRQRWSWDALYGFGGTRENPTKAPSGIKYLNILLGNFTDSTFAMFASKTNHPWNPFPPNLYRRMLFLALGDRDSAKPILHDSSTVGSLSNFYWEMTYNACWFGATTTGGYRGVDTVRNSGYTWSGANSSTTNYFTACLSAADPYVNFSDPGGGQANLIIIHPGPGEEESGRTGDIWSASYTGSFGTYDGVSITKIITCPQNSQLGVFAHEMFHQLGAPDLYDYGYSGDPHGYWSLMDFGSYNGYNISGDAPAFGGGHLMYDIDGNLTNGIDGWISGTRTDSISSGRYGDGKYYIAALDSCGEARRGNATSGVRIWRIRNNNFRDSGQVWLVENRRRTPPYEAGLPEDGLIITHIDTRMGGGGHLNDGPPCTQAYYSWVESPGYDPNLIYSASSGTPGVDSVFPSRYDALWKAAYSGDDFSLGGYAEDRIDSNSVPNSWINQCLTTTPDRTGPFIYDISREGPVMSFNVARTGLTGASPAVGYQTNTVLDPKMSGYANNANGLLDPWEKDSLKVTLFNSGAAITAGLQCSLYVVKNSQYITLESPGWKTVGSGALANNAQATSAPFVVMVDKNTPRFLDITFSLKIKSTTPAYTDTSSFAVRISPYNIEFVYDFKNITPGGSNYLWKLSPCDLAIYRDTLIVANANLDNATFQNRLYKVKRNTTNNPLVSSDTISSMNNKGAAHATNMYLGGIDIDNSGNLWYSIQDSLYNTNRTNLTPTVLGKCQMPNVQWGGSPMKRIRGVGLGPTVVDTVGPDIMPGDSLWAWWQQYNTDGSGNPVAGAMLQESLYVIQKALSGTSTVRYRFNLRPDSLWGSGNDGVNYDGSWWNGRAVEYDGSYVWTSSVWQNILIRRNPYNARIYELLPAPSTYGAYGTYGVAHEATDSAGVQYAPAGTVAYKPGARGNKHYLYCCAMDEGKIYKINATDFFVPTPCDSVKVTQVTATQNKIKWWKANANDQKVHGYIIYRKPLADLGAPGPSDSLTFKWSARSGMEVSTVDSIFDNSAKALHNYYVMPVNYSGQGGWGAPVKADPLSVELAEFSCLLTETGAVTINWKTASELDNLRWEIERSPDNVNYAKIGDLPAAGNSPTGASYTFTDPAPQNGVNYYRLVDISIAGYRTYHGPISVTVGRPTAYALAQNYPNPIGRGATTIKYALKDPGRTVLKVYNVAGQAIRTLVDGEQHPNYYAVTWDGRNGKGKPVANGVYFYKLTSGGFSDTKKMSVIR